VTASLGVASTEDSTDLEAVTRPADQRLYEAKRHGRDRVVCQQPGRAVTARLSK
jgi:PleD family two-component response regulator